MKKFVVLLGLFVLLFVTGCGNNVSELNINNTKKIIESHLKDMKDVEDDTLTDVYGLDLSLMDEHVIKLNDDGDLYAIIKTSKKSDVKNDMQDYFEKIKKFNENYSPERLEILDNRVEKEIGDYLIYIVAEKADDIYKEIVNSLKKRRGFKPLSLLFCECIFFTMS